jgi:hypothetical protein
MKTHAEIFKKVALEDKKKEPISEKLEKVHTQTRTTPIVDIAKSNETRKRSMSSAKPLMEFKQMDWVPIVWTSLGPLPRWVPGPTTRWAPGTTRLALHGT